ncbi:hypothetical protein JL721_681 [Aureococcus anophagefferens]|nr:hypothetical protein JL721_681 [Aureococcus anophagefferens]
MRRALALLLAAPLLSGRPDEGYLFVTNRGDEAVFAATRLRAVSPGANITFVSDAATLRDVGNDLDVFDVVLPAEAAMPDLDVHDSMGFRLQKLRGMLLSPYERTVYMDSDTYACRSPENLFRRLEAARADVACVMGGRGNRRRRRALAARTPAAAALWRNWERVYRTVMASTRREQPSFQKAMAAARGGGLVAERAHGLQLPQRAPLPRDDAQGRHLRRRLRRHPRPRLRGRRRGLRPPRRCRAARDCPTLSGAHRVVLYLAPPGAGAATRRIADAMGKLKVDNDFSVCGSLDARNASAADDCVARSNNVLDELDRCLDARDCFEASLGLAPDADVNWFCGGDCGARAGERAADAAFRRAADAVTARRLSDDRGVAKQMRHAGGATLVRRKDADAARHARREAAFVAASAEDATFCDAAAKAERERGARCRKP